MLKKIALAAATAGVVGLTSLGAMTTTAAAQPYPHHHGHHHKHRICRPVVHTVKWVDRHGQPHWRKVVTTRCTIRWY